MMRAGHEADQEKSKLGIRFHSPEPQTRRERSDVKHVPFMLLTMTLTMRNKPQMRQDKKESRNHLASASNISLDRQKH